MKIGISFVSIANARANLAAEIPGWDVDAVDACRDHALGRDARPHRGRRRHAADRTTFYSALYRSLLHPNVFSDANGQYPGFDGRTHVADGYDAVRELLGVGRLPIGDPARSR